MERPGGGRHGRPPCKRGRVCMCGRAAGLAHGAEAQEGLDLADVAHRLAAELGGDRAALHHQNAVGQEAQELEVLLHQQDGQAALRAQPQERLLDLVDDRGLDALGRLVEEQEPGIAHQPARQRQQLLLAARQRAPLAAEQGLEARKVGEHALERVRLAGIAVVVPGQPQVLGDRQLREDAAALGDVAEPAQRPVVRLEPGDVLVGERDMAAAGGQEAHDGLQKRRLAHAVVAEDADDLVIPDGQIDAVQDGNAPVARRQRPNLEGGMVGGWVFRRAVLQHGPQTFLPR